jgi:hypothetical protein
MIRATLAVLLALLLLTFAGTVIGEDLAKEGSGEYRSGKAATFTVIAMGKEQGQMNWEETGVVVSAPENSPFHNATFRDMGTSHIIKGKWKATGFVEYTCTNGDKIYGTMEGQGAFGGPSSGTIKLVGGTGACTGIEGILELKGIPGIKPAKEGIYQAISVGKVNCKIP